MGTNGSFYRRHPFHYFHGCQNWSEPTQVINTKSRPLFPSLITLILYRANDALQRTKYGAATETMTPQTGITYCIAHHQTINDGKPQKLMIANIKYHDSFCKAKWKMAFCRTKASGGLDRKQIVINSLVLNKKNYARKNQKDFVRRARINYNSMVFALYF